MPRPCAPLAAKLAAPALEIHRLVLWNLLGVNNAFSLRLPGEPHLLVASVIGQNGDVFSLSLNSRDARDRGAAALDALGRRGAGFGR